MKNIYMKNNVSVHKNAKIGKNVEIGPFTFIAEHVEIGEGTWIGPNVTIFDYVKIGKNCRIFPGAVVGAIPQDLKFVGEVSYVEIGDNTTIREFATINRGTQASGKSLTKVGNNCLLMSCSHVAHDCCVGDNCILVNYVGLAGEVTVEDWVIFGGSAIVHQFSRIGAHAMIGAGSKISKDIPPYLLVGREPLSYEGINIVGLRRRGFTNEQIEGIHNIYRVIYEGNLNFTDACNKVEQDFPESDYKTKIIDFIRNSKRGVVK
jgi:UDP-N-acetylglucosamine acyltransferase